MPGKAKRSPKDKQRAVERYMAKEVGVKQLAKEYGVSEPAIYQWITAARQSAVEQTRLSSLSPKQLEQDIRINKDLRIQSLEREVADLKQKLFNLLLKHNEI